ncbi:MAG: hypothetical protein EVA65_15785 [Oceanococcus sp.]|nr:MAG: hypothetical protein EVA65_15785 [Oceanococcus sp.]
MGSNVRGFGLKRALELASQVTLPEASYDNEQFTLIDEATGFRASCPRNASALASMVAKLKKGYAPIRRAWTRKSRAWAGTSAHRASSTYKVWREALREGKPEPRHLRGMTLEQLQHDERVCRDRVLAAPLIGHRSCIDTQLLDDWSILRVVIDHKLGRPLATEETDDAALQRDAAQEQPQTGAVAPAGLTS